MKTHKISLCLALFLLCSVFTAQAQWTTIKNGALWKAVNNNNAAVQAHGAGFLKYNNLWYMVGEDRSGSAGVNMYSSPDLQTWTFVKKIIPANAYASNRFIERPKLMRCPSTGNFVVWCHYEQSNYGASEAASFVSPTIDGTYTLHFGGRPLGIKSRDCNVFVDDDGTGYFVSTTDENQNLTLFRLTEDYLDVEESFRLTAFNGAQREAPAIVRINNTYFLISSLCTGWDPNQATISHSSSLTSGWTSQTNIGNPITFDTQAASILTIQGTEGTTYLYVGDRWQDPALAESKTIIFPISFNGNNCTFNYKQQFDIDFATGLTRTTPVTNRVPKAGWTIQGVSSAETVSENSPATAAIDGNLNTKWHSKYSATAAKAPHWIAVDMGANYTVSGFLAAPRQDNSTTGLVREFIFYVSTDGTNWQAVSGGAWLPYYSEVYFAPVEARYFKFVALAGSNASIAEFDILQNTVHTPAAITPRYRISPATAWTTGSNVNVSQAATLSFSPQSTGSAGSWTWALRNNNTQNTAAYSIANIVPADSGIYTAFHLDQYLQSGKVDFHINVNRTVTATNKKLEYAIRQAQAVFGEEFKGAESLQSNIDNASAILTDNTFSFAIKDSMTLALLDSTAAYVARNIAGGTDRTSAISTPNNFTNRTPAGWTGTMPTRVGYGCAEFTDTVYTFSQTINDLENGDYLVGVQALYRNGDNDNGAGYENSTEQQSARFFAGDTSIFVQSMYALKYLEAGNVNGYANSLGVADHVFEIDETSYNNWLAVKVEDGTLTLGLTKTVRKAGDWCAFNNFRLISMTAPVVGIDNIYINNNENNDNRIFSITGQYLGTGTPESLGLETGVYIRNHQKIVVK